MLPILPINKMTTTKKTTTRKRKKAKSKGKLGFFKAAGMIAVGTIGGIVGSHYLPNIQNLILGTDNKPGIYETETRSETTQLRTNLTGLEKGVKGVSGDVKDLTNTVNANSTRTEKAYKDLAGNVQKSYDETGKEIKTLGTKVTKLGENQKGLFGRIMNLEQNPKLQPETPAEKLLREVMNESPIKKPKAKPHTPTNDKKVKSTTKEPKTGLFVDGPRQFKWGVGAEVGVIYANPESGNTPTHMTDYGVRFDVEHEESGLGLYAGVRTGKMNDTESRSFGAMRLDADLESTVTTVVLGGSYNFFRGEFLNLSKLKLNVYGGPVLNHTQDDVEFTVTTPMGRTSKKINNSMTSLGAQVGFNATYTLNNGWEFGAGIEAEQLFDEERELEQNESSTTRGYFKVTKRF